MSRFLLYSHDSYGLGHLRRSTLIAAGLTTADPANEVLIVTGSPRSSSFRLPERVDVVQLPSATKDRAGGYRSRKLGLTPHELVHLRSELIAATASSYVPDLILVDHSPIGMAGELRPLLDLLRRDKIAQQPRLVLGLREIIDDVDRVERSWNRDRLWPELNQYDDVLVYGDERILSTASELALSKRIDAPVVHAGYVAPRMPDRLTPDDPYLLVTAGGGGDGKNLLQKYLAAVDAGVTRSLRSIVVTGPLLSNRRRADIASAAADLASVEVIEFTESMRSLIASASGVISMAGYNTVVEVLGAGVPALLIPRTEPRREQLIRARRLAAVGSLDFCLIDDLGPERVADFVETVGTRVRYDIDLEGVSTVVSRLISSLKSEVVHV